jgi:hypothetical protein
MQEFYMKLKICIILIILLAANFGYAQPKLITREKLDKREVTEFTDKFIKSLDETKDLKKVPQSFFADNFEDNISKIFNSDIDSEIYNQLTPKDQREMNITGYNLVYLGLMNIFSKNQAELDLSISEIALPENLFPQEINSLVKNTKFLRRAFPEKHKDDNDDDEEENLRTNPIINIDDLQMLISEMKSVVYAQQIYLNDRDSATLANYANNLNEIREGEKDSISIEKCSGNNCEGFPEKTTLISVRHFPLRLEIVKQKKQTKDF